METRQSDNYSAIHHSFTSDMTPPSLPSASSSSSSSSSESASSVASSENNSTTTHATNDSTIQTTRHSDSRTPTIEYSPFHGMDESMFPTDEDFEAEEEESHERGPGWEGIYDSHDEDDDEEEDGGYSTEEGDEDDDEDDSDDDDDDDDDDASGMSVIGSPSHAWANLLPVLLSTISGPQVPDMDNSPNWYENINININSFQQILGYPLTNIGTSISTPNSIATGIIAGSGTGGQSQQASQAAGGDGDDNGTTDSMGDGASSGSGIATPSTPITPTTAASTTDTLQPTQQQLQNTLAANTLALANYALHGVVPPGNFPSIHFSFPGPTAAFLESLGLNMLTSGLDGGLLSGDIPEYDIETAHDPESSMSDIDDGDFVGFMQNIYHTRDRYGLMDKISSTATSIREDARNRPEEITDKDMEEFGWDSQAIPWGAQGLVITREEAREVRRKTYQNFRNFVPHPHRPRAFSSTYHRPQTIPSDQQFFRFKSVDNRQQCRPTHFQLRNLLSCNTRNDVYHANGPLVTHMNPTTRFSRTLFDLGHYTSNSPIPQLFRITSMTTSKEVLVAGGYSGQYALKSLNSLADTAPTIGIVSSAQNGITNHVHVHPSRTSSTPIAIFCSNDNAIRRLDTHTNKFIDSHTFGDVAINCAATSPDTRLRLVVGDSKSVFVVDADRGTILRELRGHTDYGFAAAWSDDGIHVATGNQDMTVRIYDTRKFDEPIKVLQADMAGVRALRFSPTGMGKKVLAMAEPTDILHIVDADRGMFDREQKWDCFGNIGGIDFSDDGEDLFLANTDRWYGGVVRFERDRWQHGRHEEFGWESRAWGRRAWEGHMEELIV